jgi:hypothetical protein
LTRARKEHKPLKVKGENIILERPLKKYHEGQGGGRDLFERVPNGPGNRSRDREEGTKAACGKDHGAGRESTAKGEEMLKRLEDSIRDLVRRYEAASEENRKLREGLNIRELEIKGLKKKLEQLNNERALVREKVDALISHVEGLVSGT